MDYSKDLEKQDKTVMGYPTMARHNQTSHNYNSYPPQSYINTPISQRSPYHNSSYNTNSYYNSTYNTNPYNIPDSTYYVNYSQKYVPLQEYDSDKKVFGRFMTIMMLVLVVAMISFSIFVWFIFSTEVPEFRIASLQVPSLLITNTSILGNWQVNISISNTNDNVDIKMNNGKTAIYYDTNFLAEHPIEPFTLASKGSMNVLANLTTFPGNFLDKSVLKEASDDRKGGDINFSVQISMAIYYVSKSESKNQRLKVYCNNLKVQFGHGDQDKGEMDKSDSVECLINSYA